MSDDPRSSIVWGLATLILLAVLAYYAHKNLDIFLNWFVIAIPFLVTVGSTVLALRLPHQRHYWKFVVAAIAVGLLFSGITYWQQVRSATQATKDRTTAINETADRVAKQTTENVAKAVGDQYQSLVKSLTDQIGDLKGQLASQGKKVDLIGNSNIVTGKIPVKVEVTNSSIQSPVPPVENAKLLASEESSSLTDAPYAKKLVIQADAPINPARFAIFFADPVRVASWNPAAGNLLFYGDVHMAPNDNHVLVVNITATGDAAVRPESPLVIHVASDKPIRISKWERGPK